MARFGIRNCRVKIYDIAGFYITEEEAERFAVEFDDFDLWNNTQKVEINKPQIEKRIYYFHILFIPIFSVGVKWTTRKKNGVLYNTTELCEKKIFKNLDKVKAYWYFNIVAYILLLLLVLVIFGVFG